MDPDAEPLDAAPVALPSVEDTADRLYGGHPDAFVAARDDAVAQARAAGDRDLARAVGRLRRPTRAAWLTNLLARHRGEQLDGLLALAGDLAEAQRTLDGAALRALSAQRRRLVAAMAREGARLAAQAGEAATDPVLRDLEGILDAALADTAVATEVRSGRLTRTVSYSGFGPAGGPQPPAVPRSPGGPRYDGPGRAEESRSAGEGAVEVPPARPAGDVGAGDQTAREQAAAALAERDRAERERVERERAERERAGRESAAAAAEQAAATARDRAQEAEAARADAGATHADARARVADLVAELEAARGRERTAATATREAAAAARTAVRAAGAAAAAAERARARIDDPTREE